MADDIPLGQAALIVLGGSFGTALLSGLFSKRKSAADAGLSQAQTGDVIQTTYSRILADLRDELERNRAEYRKELEESERRCEQITKMRVAAAEEQCRTEMAEMEERFTQQIAQILSPDEDGDPTP